MSDKPQVNLPTHPLINPLSEEDRVALEAALQRLPEIQDLIDRAEDCACDVAHRRAKHEMHVAIATRLHQRFFPKHLPAVQE